MKTTVKSTCCYCGVGCGVLIETEGGRITGVSGDPDHPANFGRLCTKGASLHLTSPVQARLLTPMRRVRSTGSRWPISWDTALDEAADRFARIITEHGPDAVAFYISGQLLTEDYYVFNKLAKGLIGTNNVDTNSRLCMSSAVAGYKQTLGADAPPCSYADIASAELLLIAGANPAIAHPILFRRIEDARAANPELKVIVVDPRRTETAEIADLHLPIRPGTDIALFNGLLALLIEAGTLDRRFIEAHTQGFDALAATVAPYTPAVVSMVCEVDETLIREAARWIGRSPAFLSLYCQGLNQSSQGTHNNAALIHLHLATGQIGKPGAGPFSLTGQPNAMGGREVGGMANLLSAHRDLANPAHREEIARLWGIAAVPEKHGKTAVDLFKALKSGTIKAVWIACTNPAHSMPNVREVREALDAAEYVVLQECFSSTDTAEHADLLLPAATWGEKEGTVTNSERRISRVRAAVAPPGAARADWEIAVDFAHRLAERLGDGRSSTLFPYPDAESIFNEHRESTRGRDLDITGLSYALLDTQGPQQWPMPVGARAGKVRLYENGCFPTPDGRARFIPVEQQPTAEIVDNERPLSLISGRMRDQWHGMSRTGTVPRLFNQEDEPTIYLHGCDMRHRQLAEGDLVSVRSRRGETIVRVREGAGLKRGRAWLPMHWGSQFLNTAGANALTIDATDPHSRQPELKHAAVQVTKRILPYPIALIRRCTSPAEALEMLQAARKLLRLFPYATVSLYGRQQSLVVFRAATEHAIYPGLKELAEGIFKLTDSAGGLRYADARRHIEKRALVDRDGQLEGVALFGETTALAWLRPAMAEQGLDPALVRLALAPGTLPPKASPAKTILCKCADVSDQQIQAALATGADWPSLQDQLKCGTFCGSCVPDIKRMVNSALSRETQPA